MKWTLRFLILGNSGLRISSLLKLTWNDVVLKERRSGKLTLNADGTITKAEIAVIDVPVDSKTGFRRVY